MQNERVRHIMSEAVVWIDVDDPVSEMLRMFANFPVHHLPVVDESGVKGMLSTADVLKLEHFMPRTQGQGSAALLNERFKISAIMRSPAITAQLDDTIADAVARMVMHGIHALPVVNETNKLVGIVTTTDIMQALLHGIGIKRAEANEAKRGPSDQAMRRAIAAAQAALQKGTDTDGVAASMLHLHERNVLLEGLREDVARYLHGGQDQQLHTRLLKNLGHLNRQSELSAPL